MNMIECDEKDMIPDIEKVDIFCPMESLNGQCIAEFKLKDLDTISTLIKTQTDSNSKVKLKNSIIQDFCHNQINGNKEDVFKYGESLINDLMSIGFIRKRNAMINCLYGITPLYRCFYGEMQTL